MDLAFRFPELVTLASCDILPSSWISVAWYSSLILCFDIQLTHAQWTYLFYDLLVGIQFTGYQLVQH